MENDDLDFFEEQTDSVKPNQYFHKGEWKQMQLREEIIHVKDSGDYKLICRSTVHGPVCTDVIHDFADVTTSPVSASWVLLQFPSNLCDITYRLARATSMEEFREGISTLATPGLNVVYGDSSGNIAWWAAAKLVKRPQHVEPRLLLNGSTGNDDWLGFYDFAENPHRVNPASGFVYTCNNAPDSVPGVSTPGYYTPEDRARIVTAFLSQEKKFTQADMNELNNNVTSVVAAELAHHIISKVSSAAKSKSEISKKAADILASWNGNMTIDDAGPTIYYMLQYQLLWKMMGDEIGQKSFMQFQQTHIQKNSVVPMLMNDSGKWYDDITTREKTETYQEIFDAAFDTTILILQKQLGDVVDQWKWGRVHILEHVHPIGRQKPFDKFFNIGPFPVGGGNETVNQQGFDFNPSGTYMIKFGPALRRTLDFADPSHAQSILPTGQSGNVMSPHYGDQAEMFVQGKTRMEWTSKGDVIREAVNHLIFTKEKNQ